MSSTRSGARPSIPEIYRTPPETWDIRAMIALGSPDVTGLATVENARRFTARNTRIMQVLTGTQVAFAVAATALAFVSYFPAFLAP